MVHKDGTWFLVWIGRGPRWYPKGACSLIELHGELHDVVGDASMEPAMNIGINLDLVWIIKATGGAEASGGVVDVMKRLNLFTKSGRTAPTCRSWGT